MYPESSTAQRLTEVALKGATSRLKTVRKEARNLGVNTPGMMDNFIFGSPRSATGISVNEETAMRSTAVYACVSYIADYVASLPKILYQDLSKDSEMTGKKRAKDHYLYPILHDRPNPFQNDYEFVETLTGHVLLRGNAYAEVERDNGGQVKYLWPLRPDRMRIVVTPERLMYFYTVPGGEERVIREVLHLRGLASDGLIGYSPINLARESIGLALAEEEYRARFLGNNASPGGVLQHPGTLGKVAMENLRTQWESSHGGLTNSHRVAVLEEGLKWQQVGLPAKDMEFIEGRRFQKTDIATLFRVKPYKIGILEPGTVSYASIEAQQIDNHIDTMRPWVIRWEKKFNTLLNETEQRRYFCEFLLDAVLRGDSKTRAETLQIWRQNGIINADDWLNIENRNPLPGDKGKDYWQPSNMIVVGKEPPLQGDLFPQPGAPKPSALNGAAH